MEGPPGQTERPSLSGLRGCHAGSASAGAVWGRQRPGSGRRGAWAVREGEGGGLAGRWQARAPGSRAGIHADESRNPLLLPPTPPPRPGPGPLDPVEIQDEGWGGVPCWKYHTGGSSESPWGQGWVKCRNVQLHLHPPTAKVLQMIQAAVERKMQTTQAMSLGFQCQTQECLRLENSSFRVNMESSSETLRCSKYLQEHQVWTQPRNWSRRT